MSELVPGGNLPLPGGALTFRVSGPFDVSALVTDDSGTVRGDGDFVFYNQPAAPGARLSGATLRVDPAALRAGASRVTVVVSPAEPGTPPGRLPAPALLVTDSGGRTVARFVPPRPHHESVLLLAEVYRRGAAWKLRALGQGYADGLAGIARDFGVKVAEDADAGPGPAAGSGAPAVAVGSGDLADRFLGLVNSVRGAAGSPAVALDGRLVAAARSHAAGMAAWDRLGSGGPDGLSVHQRVTAEGYAYLAIGEHLVSGPRDPAEFVEYCLTDDRSRRTLQDPAFTHAGVARVPGGRSGTPYWTALWARPLTPAGLARTTSEVLALTNAGRAAAGLPPLAEDPLLTRAAQAHSADMAARAFYSHTSPDGSEPWHRAAAAGSTRRTVGENIACGQRSPAEVVRGWMDSPGHRANILKPAFTHLGVGYAGGGAVGTYWTQLFGG
ncbi:CAP domain-containing protein [Streptomyces beigongshangae]|uniref:CAP domain-containing protein n=1 Tax=Streptomyces beigongshangae TaxID=2841597 RepID=UPI001C855ED8|nr:CAP domain-containing protein [Streptomyces sp. REN17]